MRQVNDFAVDLDGNDIFSVGGYEFAHNGARSYCASFSLRHLYGDFLGTGTHKRDQLSAVNRALARWAW
jgi:hypothetical protein